MVVVADPNMGPREQTSGENGSTSNKEGSNAQPSSNLVTGSPNQELFDMNIVSPEDIGICEMSTCPSNKVVSDLDNTENSANRGPGEINQTTDMETGSTEQVPNDTLLKDLTAEDSKETAGNPPCSSTNYIYNKIEITSDEVVSLRQLPHHSKPFKKRSLSVELSREPTLELKRPKNAPVQETSVPTAPLTSEEKITPTIISKVKSGPKPKYTIKNSYKNTSSPVASAPKQVQTSSQANENDNTLDIIEGICKQLTEINNHAQTLSTRFQELTTSLDENATSCEKVYSLMDDLVALYGDGFNDGDSDYDSDDNPSESDEDDQQDDTIESQSEATPRINPQTTDSKWTLKYQQQQNDTTELIPGSRVYVSKTGLVRCRNLANTPTMLARLLLEEIFTKQALLKCSFTGVCVKINGVARPPLDRDGTTALIQFIQQFSVENGWDLRSYQEIKKSITRYLSLLRKNRVG